MRLQPTRRCRWSTTWPQVNAKGGFAPAEAYAIHRERLERRGADIDPNIRVRIERGGTVPAADYIDMMRSARAWCGRWTRGWPASTRW